MKYAIGFLMSAVSTIAFACPEEAQIIATIASATAKSSNTCTVFIDASSVTLHAPNDLCGVTIAAMVTEGIVVHRDQRTSCTSAQGKPLNGIVKRNVEGQLVLE